MSDPTDDMAVVVVRRGQQRAAAAPIAAGHADYPSFRFVFPDPRRRAKLLPVFFEATVRDAIPYGAVLAATHGDRVDATAVWLPPGGFPWTLRRKLRAAPSLARVMVAAPRSFPMFMRYGANIEATHRDEQHWYLVVLSVRPECQRRGLGSALVEPILDRADRDALPCQLETSDPANVAFYQRFGFEVIDPAFPAIPGGPTLTTMRRPQGAHLTEPGHKEDRDVEGKASHKS
jgi:ribosomal protein S18 acetylase RimI-like enzyme